METIQIIALERAVGTKKIEESLKPLGEDVKFFHQHVCTLVVEESCRVYRPNKKMQEKFLQKIAPVLASDNEEAYREAWEGLVSAKQKTGAYVGRTGAYNEYSHYKIARGTDFNAPQETQFDWVKNK